MTRKDPDTLPALVQVTVQTHINMLDAALPGLLLSYHVIGSAALGAFEDRRSDVDFIAVLRRGLTDEGIAGLKSIHSKLKNSRMFAVLDGLYVPMGALGCANGGPPACARFNEGRFHGMQRFEPNSPDAWLLKQHGISFTGSDASILPFNVDWDALLRNQAENVNTYWRKWAADCRNPLSPKFYGLYAGLDMVEWGVLGISRIYFTIRERDVISKVAAGRYALETVPERWHRVIREAMRLRMPETAPQYKTVIKRRKDALGYMEFMILECDRIHKAYSSRY